METRYFLSVSFSIYAQSDQHAKDLAAKVTELLTLVGSASNDKAAEYFESRTEEERIFFDRVRAFELEALPFASLISRPVPL